MAECRKLLAARKGIIMNWFKHDYPTDPMKVVIMDSACEHCESDISQAFVIAKEMDSFGPVASHVMCKACFAIAQEEEAKEEVFCADCKTTVLKSEALEWRWYDFYAAQGDEPRIICKTCWSLPKHQHRIERDRYQAQREDEYHASRR